MVTDIAQCDDRSLLDFNVLVADVLDEEWDKLGPLVPRDFEGSDTGNHLSEEILKMMKTSTQLDPQIKLLDLHRQFLSWRYSP